MYLVALLSFSGVTIQVISEWLGIIYYESRE